MVAGFALAVLLLGTGLAGAGPSKPRIVRLPASLAFNKTVNQYGCFLTAGILYKGVYGATSYTIKYTDDVREMVKTQPPFDDEAETNFKWGVHFVGIAGFNSSDVRGCPNAEAGYRSRFKAKGVTAVVDLKDAHISGRVTFEGRPLRGIPVTAHGPSRSASQAGPSFGAATDASGSYRITIPKTKLAVYGVHADMSRTRYSDAGERLLVESGQEYTVDLAVRVPPAQDPGAVASVTEIRAMDRSRPAKAEFLRDGSWFTVTDITQLRPGERVRTDANTAVALELDLGGRVAIKPGSEIEVTGERSVTDRNPQRGFKLTKGGVWAQCGRMKESLEIQTTGGVMGIKG